MSVISNIYQSENTTIISFEHIPANIDFLNGVFQGVKREHINVDMISQTAPKGELNSMAFTVNDDDMPRVISVIGKLKETYGDITPMVSAGNVKISLYGKEMPQQVGVAADVFNVLSNEKIDILLITTSDVDISIVVSKSNADKAYRLLKENLLNKNR